VEQVDCKQEISIDVTVPSTHAYIALIGRIVEDVVDAIKLGYRSPETLGQQLNLVVTEAATNSHQHANLNRSDASIHVSLSYSNQELRIKVFDQGPGFDLNLVDEPDPDSLEEHGRGIFLIKSLMDSVAYNRGESGNVLEMIKNLD
jgi:serine/threonine-protein kinase RsbW